MQEISQVWKLELFKWVMFWDEMASFSDEALKLGYYLGSNIDVAWAMMAKIIMQNGQVFHISTHRPLTPDEVSNQEG